MENQKEKTYKVEITETLQRTVEVKASSSGEAIEKVKESYRSENIVLDWQDFVGNEFEIVD